MQAIGDILLMFVIRMSSIQAIGDILLMFVIKMSSMRAIGSHSLMFVIKMSSTSAIEDIPAYVFVDRMILLFLRLLVHLLLNIDLQFYS